MSLFCPSQFPLPHVFHKQCNLPPESQSTPWHWLRHSAKMYELHLGLRWWPMRFDFPYMPQTSKCSFWRWLALKHRPWCAIKDVARAGTRQKNNCARTVNINCSFLIVSPPTLCLCSLIPQGSLPLFSQSPLNCPLAMDQLMHYVLKLIFILTVTHVCRLRNKIWLKSAPKLTAPQHLFMTL